MVCTRPLLALAYLPWLDLIACELVAAHGSPLGFRQVLSRAAGGLIWFHAWHGHMLELAPLLNSTVPTCVMQRTADEKRMAAAKANAAKARAAARRGAEVKHGAEDKR